MLLKNVASQKFYVYAYTPADGLPKTGDAAQITAYVAKDFGAATVLADTSASEVDATNAPGMYVFDAAQGETNAEVLMVSGKSSTSGVKVLGAPAVIYTMPTTGVLSPATLGRTAVVDANGLIDANTVKVGPTGSGTAQTAGDIPARLPAALGANGNMKADVRDVNGVAQTATLDTIKAVDDAILVDTGTTLDGRLPAALTAGGMIKASVNEWKESTAAVVDTAGYPVVTIKTGTGAGEINMASGIVQSNAVAISGDTVAADNLEAACDGTTYNIGGGAVVAASVTGAVGSVTGAVGSVTGAVGSVTGAVGSVTGAVGSVTGAVGSVAAGGITAASIAAGAVDADALATDAVDEIVAGILAGTITELSAIPAASPSLKQALALLYMALRNKVTVTSSAKTVYNDAGTSLGAKALTDDGTTYTEAEIA